MQIHGFNKTTLLDYPGIVAATVFTGSCNFRCPFCQNADLVLNPSSQPLISEEEILEHLSKRKGITKGVCITGGEPTLQEDLPDFASRLQKVGLLVKLDTNGYRPDVLKELIDKKLINYVAMDIKAPLCDYSRVAGVKVDTQKIRESVSLLINSEIPHEFRTTVVRELHDEESFLGISELIKGAKNYYLQGYVDSDRVICRGYTSYPYSELEAFLPIFEGKVSRVSIRGVDE